MAESARDDNVRCDLYTKAGYVQTELEQFDAARLSFERATTVCVPGSPERSYVEGSARYVDRVLRDRGAIYRTAFVRGISRGLALAASALVLAMAFSYFLSGAARHEMFQAMHVRAAAACLVGIVVLPSAAAIGAFWLGWTGEWAQAAPPMVAGAFTIAMSVCFGNRISWVPKKRLRSIVLLVAAFGILVGISIAARWAHELLHGTTSMSPSPGVRPGSGMDSTEIVGVPLRIGLGVAAVGEELVYRGWFLAAFPDKWPVWRAFLINALLFSAIHVGRGAAYTLDAFLAALVLCAVTRLTGSPILAVVLHVLANLLARPL